MKLTRNRGVLIGWAAVVLALAGCGAREAAPPNIVWIITEDHSRDDVAIYGNPDVATPHIDGLAAEGVRFTNAYAAAPSCSPTRSGLITGMYPIQIGAHNQRNDSATLPAGVKLLPQYLRDAGYFCVNVLWDNSRPGKTDFQFQWDKAATYDDALDWADRAPEQPFFAQVHIAEPHRNAGIAPGQVFARDPQRPIDPATVTLPPYYPDDPVVRLDFAQYLEAVQMADRKVGHVLAKLDQDDDAANTVVFFFGDHGRPFPHGKQFLYDEGLAFPFIIRWPGHLDPGKVRDDLVSMLDFAPTVMRIAGLTPPAHMVGADILNPDTPLRESIFASRDRVDDALDRIRCIRTVHYKYIRNFHPEKPYDMDESYMLMVHPTLSALRKVHAEGKLTPLQAKWMAPNRPEEELYDIKTDPLEANNLAADPAHQETLLKLRAQLTAWIEETNDRGATPETPAELEAIRQNYQEFRTKSLTRYGLTSPDELYDYWLRTLRATVP
jgi:N-sulfoglucosamine sulfohydrolase